jgi:hypothetical protein
MVVGVMESVCWASADLTYGETLLRELHRTGDPGHTAWTNPRAEYIPIRRLERREPVETLQLRHPRQLRLQWVGRSVLIHPDGQKVETPIGLATATSSSSISLDVFGVLYPDHVCTRTDFKLDYYRNPRVIDRDKFACEDYARLRLIQKV